MNITIAPVCLAFVTSRSGSDDMTYGSGPATIRRPSPDGLSSLLGDMAEPEDEDPRGVGIREYGGIWRVLVVDAGQMIQMRLVICVDAVIAERGRQLDRLKESFRARARKDCHPVGRRVDLVPDIGSSTPLARSAQATFQRWLRIGAESVHTFGMTLKSAAFFALVGMALLTVLLTVSLIVNISSVARGLLPAMVLVRSLVEWVAAVSLLVFFAVFHKTQ
jgi:hypothetical protein